MDCLHFRRCSQALQCSTSKCFSDSRAPVAAAQRRPSIRVSRWGCRGPPPLRAAAAASSSPSTSRPKADGPARGGGRRPARSGGRSRGGRGARWKKGAGSHFFSTKSWKQVGASEEMVEAVELLNITRPSHIQAAAYEAYENATQHLVVGDHAGSGKTLAYLMPVLQQLRREEAESSGPPAAGGGPRALVICPTEELAVQTYSVVRALSKAAPLRSACLTGGHKWRSQKQMLEAGVDVVVATPGRLQDHLSAGTMDLAQCRAVVLDEVDVLLGQNADFGEQMDLLQSHVPASSRFLFVTATLPEDIYAQMEMQFPANLRLVIGPGFHRTAPGVVERILDCSGGEEISEESGFERKAMALGAVLDETPAARSIIFCNKIATCRKVENFLKRRDRSGSAYRVLPYHSAIEDGTRKGNLQAFMRPPDADARSQDLILVCTDRASRGLDSSFTQHVVLFDFPRDPSEYVRRVGRTARGASGSGNVTVLVLGRQVKLAQELSNRNNKGLPVHRVPAAPGA